MPFVTEELCELTGERGLVTVEDIPAVARSAPGRGRHSFGIRI